MVEHVNITDPNIHEPKGIANASEEKVYVSDGSGSGDWELHRDTGWGLYQDTSGGTQVFSTTSSKLIIDGGGALTNETYLPRSIRGSGSLWDTTNNKITPIAIADSYNVRVDLDISSKSGSPSYLDVELDIGGLASTSNVIVQKGVSMFNTAPFKQSFGFTIFSLGTFLSNGGQIFIATDSGTVTIDSAKILIVRTHYE